MTMRILAVCLVLGIVCVLLTTYSVFSQRRSFAENGQIVFEVGAQDRTLFSMTPNSSFGEDLHYLFDPEYHFGDRYVTGVDCSPDGHSLIFWYNFLYRYDIPSEILTELVAGHGLSQMSVWSPDGQQIAYLDDIADRQPREIFVINADGSHKTQITSNDYKENSLTWSPDGRQIAFTYFRNDDPSRSGLAIVDVAGGQTTVLDEADHVADASWSPDGSRIAFDSIMGTRTDIYTIRPDGSGLTKLTSAWEDNILPRWSPDGTMISFSARAVDGHYQLYLMDGDGSQAYLVFPMTMNEDVFNRCWLKG